ncbi:S66 family peptidase [Robertmurraya massiliosenegalensis]|uniref:S66 family peptidase n=1 Tax=Robertmurraya massiliosenegalensis TaxID=1287657 RepID=UPI0002D7C3E1|nr:S66 peptidase family protein [Robertmurraya massiliosenegalensis]
MIRYPILTKGATIGVTAPSSGVPENLREIVYQAFERLKKKGYEMISGATVWNQNKAKSASATLRANELNSMMQTDDIDIIIPPWGGELLIEILEHIDFRKIEEKWILGYSDISVLLLAITLKTGMATAHGTNLVDLRGEYSDETTAMWESVLSTKVGETITQKSSPLYQKKWNHENPSPCVYHLSEETYWKTVGNQPVAVEGRLLGGCVDVIRHLIGTPYGDVGAFRATYVSNEPIIWYLENCELSTADVRRSLMQMKLAGWFDGCAAILFGRSSANTPVEGYTIEDVYEDMANELQIPIVYDIDCGHVPPQITFINGAHAEIQVANGKGIVTQQFKP